MPESGRFYGRGAQGAGGPPMEAKRLLLRSFRYAVNSLRRRDEGSR
jgi:hypothetical protein